MKRKSKILIGIISSVSFCLAICVCLCVASLNGNYGSNKSAVIQEKLANIAPQKAEFPDVVNDAAQKDSAKPVANEKVKEVAKAIPDLGIPSSDSEKKEYSEDGVELIEFGCGMKESSVLTVTDDMRAKQSPDSELEPTPVYYKIDTEQKKLWISSEAYTSDNKTITGKWEAKYGSYAPWHKYNSVVKEVIIEKPILPVSINSFFSTATTFGQSEASTIETITNFDNIVTGAVETADYAFAGLRYLKNVTFSTTPWDNNGAAVHIATYMYPKLVSASCMYQWSLLNNISIDNANYFHSLFTNTASIEDNTNQLHTAYPQYFDAYSGASLRNCPCMFANIFMDESHPAHADVAGLIPYLDMSLVKNAYGMFANNPYIGSQFIMPYSSPLNSCNLSYFLNKCISLREVNMCSWAPTHRADVVDHMFANCQYLKTVLCYEGTDWSKVIGSDVILFDGVKGDNPDPADDSTWCLHYNDKSDGSGTMHFCSGIEGNGDCSSSYAQISVYDSTTGDSVTPGYFTSNGQPEIDYYKITQKSSRLDYAIGESISVLRNGIEVRAFYKFGGTRKLNSDEFTIVCKDTSTILEEKDNFSVAGEYQVYAKIENNETINNFTIKVVEDKKLKEIGVTKNPTKTTYYTGDTLNTNGLQVTAYFTDGSSATVKVSDCTISPTQLTKANDNQKINVSYQYEFKGIVDTAKTQFTVKVIQLEPISLEIKGQRTEYLASTISAGSNVDVSSITATAKYNNGTSKDVTAAAKDSVTPAKISSKTAGYSQEETLSFTDCGFTVTAKYTLTILAKPKPLQINWNASYGRYEDVCLPIFDSTHKPAGINFYRANTTNDNGVLGPDASPSYTDITKQDMKGIYNTLTGNKPSDYNYYPKYNIYYTGTTDFVTMPILMYYIRTGAPQDYPFESWKGGDSYTGQWRKTDSSPNYSQEHWIGLEWKTVPTSQTLYVAPYIYLFDPDKANEYVNYSDDRKVASFDDIYSIADPKQFKNLFWPEGLKENGMWGNCKYLKRNAVWWASENSTYVPSGKHGYWDNDQYQGNYHPSFSRVFH